MRWWIPGPHNLLHTPHSLQSDIWQSIEHCTKHGSSSRPVPPPQSLREKNSIHNYEWYDLWSQCSHFLRRINHMIFHVVTSQRSISSSSATTFCLVCQAKRPLWSGLLEVFRTWTLRCFHLFYRFASWMRNRTSDKVSSSGPQTRTRLRTRRPMRPFGHLTRCLTVNVASFDAAWCYVLIL